MSDFVLASGYELVSRLDVPWRVAYLSDGRLFVHDLSNDRRKSIFEERGGNACPLAWTVDGKSVLRSHGNELVAIDVRTKKRATLVRSQGRVTWFVSCSPAGNEVVYFDHARGKREIRAFDLRTHRKRLVSGVDKAWRVACDWSHRMLVVASLEPAIWRVSLDDGSAERLVDVEASHVNAAFGRFVYERARLSPEEAITGTIWLRSLDGKTRELVSNDGLHASLSPDAKKVAYMRGEDQLVVHDVATRNTEHVLHAPRANARGRA